MHIIGNVIEEIKKLEDCSQNLIFTDPPYNLGSTWFINKENKPEVKIKADFMNKWEGLTPNDLESMFNDFFRILKYGGFCIFAGQARQVMAFQYYAIKAGFDMIEPIYSFNISNFPKSLNVSKALDKHFGEEREVVGKRTGRASKPVLDIRNNNFANIETKDKRIDCSNITAPASDLAKKYDGIHSSICPLKQTTEIWNIFRKPFRHGTIVKDILAYEDGDETIHLSGLNIDEGRIPTNDNTGRPKGPDGNCYGHYEKIITESHSSGRYPAQLFLDGLIDYKREDIDLKDKNFLSFIGIDPDCIKFMDTDKALNYVCSHLDKFDVSKLLDDQSGILKGTDNVRKNNQRKYSTKENAIYGVYNDQDSYGYKDSGGCSRILHKASFVLPELYQHIYYSKPSNYERNAGCDDFEERYNLKSHNNHPTLKSLKLLYLIIQLFKTPDHDKQKVLIPFSGVFSEKIAFLAYGYLDENITTIEISQNYSDIGQAREQFWKEHNYFFKEEKDGYNKNKEVIKNDDKETGKLF